MKSIRKLIIVCIALMFLVIGSLFLLTGKARTDVYLKDFEVSSDGKKMILKVGVLGSTGYVRKIKRTSDSTNGYYTFYSTYGINSRLGAKDTFEIELDEDMNEIYFYTGSGGYKLVLTRYVLNKWYSISYADDGKIQINLPKKEDIIKIGINTGSQNNNYFEYDDKDSIEKLYSIFDGLETATSSMTYNPDVRGEMYAIFVYTSVDDKPFYYSIYNNNEKYFVEQSYNGIYEVSEEDFNTVKSYIK